MNARSILIVLSFGFFLAVILACSTVAKHLWEPFQGLLLPLVELRGMNPLVSRDLVDRLVSGNRLARHPGLELPVMLPSLCHSSLLSDATIPQRYYLIHWSKKPGVLYRYLCDPGVYI